MSKLKIVYPICCGMDVHRDFVIACVASTNSQGVTSYSSKRFSTFSGGLRDLRDWLAQQNCKDVCMESTGKYWFPVHNILEKTCNVVVSHPKFVKAIKGKKTDKKDAQWIADLFKHDLVRGSFILIPNKKHCIFAVFFCPCRTKNARNITDIAVLFGATGTKKSSRILQRFSSGISIIPPEDIRQLRDLCRYWCKLTSYTTGEKNRAQNCLTVSNFKLDSVFSNVFGKSASAIISHMLEHPGEQFDVTPFVDRRCKTPIDVIQAAADGSFNEFQAEKLKIIREHMDDLGKLKALLESQILTLAEPYIHQINLLCTLPGVSDPMTAIRIIAEIGVEMTVFESSKHLCSWAGLTPQNNESAGKKKTTRIGKAGQYIKPLLIQCACAASRSDKYPEIKGKFGQLKKRRGAKKARVAIARRLLTAIYQMLLKNEVYTPFAASAEDSIPEQRILSQEQAFALLRAKGYLIQSNIA